MSNSVIGSLRVNLGLDAAQFQRGARQAEGTLQTLSRRMQQIGAGISAIGAGIALAVRGQLNAIDDLVKTADRIGMPVEALSQLQFAADLSGVSAQTLQGSMQRLARTMVESAGTLHDLGVATRDSQGRMRPLEAVLMDVADVLARMEPGAERTALAIQLLGRSGAELLPMLQGGADGIRSMMQEADRLGLTISDRTARQVEAFNDNLSRLRAQMTGLARQITAALVPVLESISNAVVELSQRFAGMTETQRTWAAAIAGITIVAGPAIIAIGTLIRSLAALRLALVALSGPWGILATAVALSAGYMLAFRRQAEPVEGTLQAVEAAQVALNAALGTFHETAAPSAGREALSYARNLERQAAAALAAAEAELALMQAELARFQSAPMEERGLLGDMEEGAMRRNLAAAQGEIDGLRTTLDNARQTVYALRRGLTDDTGPTFLGTVIVKAERIEPAIRGAGGAARQAAGSVDEMSEAMRRALGVIAQMNSDTVTHADVIEALQQLYAQGAISADQLAEAIRRVGEEMGGLGEMAQQFQSSFETAFVGFVTGAQSARQAIQRLLQDLARLLAQRAFQGLFGGMFTGGGGVLAGLFGGARSFQGGGFTGNAPRVGGLDGRGGFPAILHPNETVIDHNRRAAPATAGGQLVVRLDLSADVEARIMSKAEGMQVEMARAQERALPAAIQKYQANPRRT